MERVVLKSKVSKDGVLHLDVPVGVQEAGKEVHVTVESHVHASTMAFSPH